MSNQRTTRSSSGKDNKKRPAPNASAANRKRPPQKHTQKSRDEVRREQAIRRKKQKRKKQLIIYTFSFLFLIVVGIILSLTVFFRISEITVEGNSIYSKKDIISASGIKLQDNLFLFNKEEINQSITKNLSYIGSVTINRKLPGKVVLSVKATTAKCAVKLGDAYALIDSTGKVLQLNAVLQDGEKPIILDGCVVTEALAGEKIKLKSDKFDVLTRLLNALESSSIAKITQIDLTSDMNITMLYDGRITLIVGSLSEIDSKLALAKEVLKKQDKSSPYEKGRLDLTISKKAYYTPEKTETTAAAAATTAGSQTVSTTGSTAASKATTVKSAA